MIVDYRTYTDESLKREYALCKQEIAQHEGGLESERGDLKAILGEAIRRKLYISAEAENDTDELIPHDTRHVWYNDDSLLANHNLLKQHIQDLLEDLTDSFGDLERYEEELIKRGLIAEKSPMPFFVAVPDA